MIEITEFTAGRWEETAAAARRARDCCEMLERGEILLLRDSALPSPPENWEILTHIPEKALTQKNVSYDPGTDLVRGVRGVKGVVPLETIRAALRTYCEQVASTCETLLAPYASHWRVELASFRPLEEKTRRLPPRERNDRLHIDSFPSRPTNGARILRCFTNIHPSHPRVWITSDPLNTFRPEMLIAAGLKQVMGVCSPGRRNGKALRRIARLCGIPMHERPPYDRFMLRLHDYMKSSASYYANARVFRHVFPPGSTWLVFTDAVPHAVLQGQFALEQTFLVPKAALVRPDHAPVAFLEGLVGNRITV